MLLNKPRADVAERPEDSSSTAGPQGCPQHEALRAIVGVLLELGPDDDAARPVRQAGRIFTTHENAPRVLIANSLLVPKWATWDGSAARGGGLTMFGQMTAARGLHRHAGSCRAPSRRYASRRRNTGARPTSAADDPHRRARRVGGAQPLPGRWPAPRSLHPRFDPHRIRAPARDALSSTRRRSRPTRRCRGSSRCVASAHCRSACRNAAEIVPELARAASASILSPTRPPPMTRSRLRPVGLAVDEAAALRAPIRTVPTASARVDRRARRGDARVLRLGRMFRLWQQPASEAVTVA